MGSDDRLALASVLVEKVREALDHSAVDRVNYGRIVLRDDANTLYSLVSQWRNDAT